MAEDLKKYEGKGLVRDSGRTAWIRKPFIAFFTGLIVGVILTSILIWISIPRLMLVEHRSRFGTVEETCERLKIAIEAQGWSVTGIRDINRTLEKQGIKMNRQVRIVELCKAEYAKMLLEKRPEVSTLMPCAWGVYQGDDGMIHISGMNIGLMGKMFGGIMADIMGNRVAADERTILKNIVVE
jgi:uncharacterized protein (DUF302 family)